MRIYIFYIFLFPEFDMSSFLLAFRNQDSAQGITRGTLKALAEKLGVSETQAIHLALARLAATELPAYEADNEPVTDDVLQAIGKMVPQGQMTVSSSLFGLLGGEDVEDTQGR